MVKSLKSFHNILIVFLFFTSCENNNPSISVKESKLLSQKIFENEFGSHDHTKPKQGTSASMSLLDSILKLDPTNASAWREISIPYLKRGMPLQWKPLFDKAVEHDAQTWVPMRGYLYLFFYRDYKKAIADFDASDTLTPHLDYPQGHSVDFWRGIAYLGLKDYENSIAYWDKHITKETEDSGEDWVELEAFLYRGIAFYESGNSAKALENFDKILHYFKTSADAKYYKALILKDADKKEEGLTITKDAIIDFKAGFYNNRDYVEALRQIYLEDLEDLKSTLEN